MKNSDNSGLAISVVVCTYNRAELLANGLQTLCKQTLGISDYEVIDRGVLSILRQLHGRYRLAVLSNSPPGLTEWLSAWGILELMDLVYCSGDEGKIKPDPAVYKQTLSRLGILAHEAVFIDDTMGHVNAARSLGIHGILFANAEQLRLELDYLLDPRKNILSE
jgi:putative hydrolase of the HAD superfamily